MKKIFLEDCEKKVLKNVSKEVKNISVNKRKDVIQEETLTEGLKFFKASERLYKLAIKLEKKSKQNPAVQPAVKRINKLANKFEYVEDLYDIGRKAEAKASYKELQTKYTDLLKILQKEEVRNALKKIGALGFTIASMTIPYIAMNKFFPNLSFSKVNENSKELAANKQIGLYLKRAGAFILCGLPVKVARNAYNVSLDNYETQIIKSVDRLLKSEEANA